MVSIPFKPLQSLPRTLFISPHTPSFSSLPKPQLRSHSPNQSPQCFESRLRHHLETVAATRTLDSVKCLHALTIQLGTYTRQPIFYFNNVITMYVGFGELGYARKVFDGMRERNVVSYNALIAGYCWEGRVGLAWDVWSDMRGCGVWPTHATFGSLLACDGVVVGRGEALHGVLVKSGLFWSQVVAGTALMGMYGRVGCVEEARWVFDELPEKSLITWNLMMSLLGIHGFTDECLFLFGELRRLDCGLSGTTIVSLMSTIVGEGELGLGEQIHGLAMKNGLNCEVSVSNLLLNMYAKCSDVALAEKVLEEMPFQDIVSYNTIIGAYSRDGDSPRAFELLHSLSDLGVLPNKTTYVGLINCCASLRISQYGEYIHAKAIRNAYQHNVFVGSALVDFYGKCEMISAAHRCFGEIHDKNVTSWNALIFSYATKCSDTSIALMRDMCRSGLQPCEFTFSSLMKTSVVFQLQMLHGLTITMGYHDHEYVFSSLVNSYAKNGLTCDALRVAAFFVMPLQVVSSNILAAIYSRTGQYEKSLEILSMLDEPDEVSWNVLISACSHKGYHDEVFEVFRFMLMAKVPHDNHTAVSVLSSCTKISNLPLGSSVHGLLIKTCFQRCDTFVCNILIGMYAKCGTVASSVKIFDETSEKNLITYTTLISTLGHHGSAREALERFREMELLRIKPDRVTFIALLSACRHGGLVKEGMGLFSRMESVYGIRCEMDHYHCAVDLLARYGHPDEAEEVIAKMPFCPNAMIWRSFLGGRRGHGTSVALSVNGS